MFASGTQGHQSLSVRLILSAIPALSLLARPAALAPSLCGERSSPNPLTGDNPRWTSTSAVSLSAASSHEPHRSSDSEPVVADAISHTMTMTMNYNSNDQTSQALVSLSRDLQPATQFGQSGDSEEVNAHSAKRQRILACKRCRHRKQKVGTQIIELDHLSCC